MNKYQDSFKNYNALLKAVCKSDYEEFHYYVTVGDEKAFKELVDLRTPKECLRVPVGEDIDILCPTCKTQPTGDVAIQMGYVSNFCEECGQALLPLKKEPKFSEQEIIDGLVNHLKTGVSVKEYEHYDLVTGPMMSKALNSK